MSSLLVGPLVRCVNATSAVLWAELTEPGEIVLKASSVHQPDSEELAVRVATVTVGDHHYAAPQLSGLQPATWYTYHFSTASKSANPIAIAPQVQQCFRTLDLPETPGPLTLAYGSCRKLNTPNDALSALGPWLLEHFNERETAWPRLLLLIGDQIYADEPADSLLAITPELSEGAKIFADFARMYTYAWTSDDGVRQALATIPTYMIFDDHEITNNWNISPTWRAEAIRHGMESILVDGLVAYWVYQGWGNLDRQATPNHPLLRIMQEAQLNGKDALDELRAYIRREVYGEIHLPWYYTIPTAPPIFVADVRADRPAIFELTTDADAPPARIMSPEQMENLKIWLAEHDTTLTILVSSVPILLPPLIGLGEYLMGIRPWHRSIAPLRWLGKRLAHIQQRLAFATSFDHWPLFSATWRELVRLLTQRRYDVLALSGDVHFSYAMEAHRGFASHAGAHLYQFVSTPLQNRLGSKDALLVKNQAWWKRLVYGGLHTRMLPLKNIRGKNAARVLLLQNTLAFVTTYPGSQGSHILKQEYMGTVEGHLVIIGSTDLSQTDKGNL